jgi:hypothetical protein
VSCIRVSLGNEEFAPVGTLLVTGFKDSIVQNFHLFEVRDTAIILHHDLFRPKFAFTNVSSISYINEFLEFFSGLIKVFTVDHKWSTLGEIIDAQVSSREFFRKHVQVGGPYTNDNHEAG